MRIEDPNNVIDDFFEKVDGESAENMDSFLASISRQEAESSKPKTKFGRFLKSKGAFGYNWRYLLTHPWKIVREIFYEVKYAWQRVFRGWDDRMVWGVDYTLSELIPQLLLRLKEIKHGIPMSMFDRETWHHTNEEMEIGEQKWNKILDEMAEGFIFYHENKYNSYSDEEIKELEHKLKHSMDLLSEHFMDLWD